LVNFAGKYKAGSSSLQLSFDMGYLPNVTYYIDDIKVVEKRSTSNINPALVKEALEKWINGMMAHYKGKVKAWDVVNEPMDDGSPSTVKTGKNKTLASDEFYWQDYLGDKDYAVTAFKLARAAANAGDILFINDYNLEQSLAKCDGLINYVKEIELLGAEVNGIGTQMHISINTNKDNIAQMFERLGRTGKLIKISELDIKIGTASPTTEQYTQQAEMYQYVIDMYLKYIPEAQRYGISVWGISDNANEHVYWISNDAPNLWDKDYQRKHAYKGFADGLAGKDVSEDFTENLQ
jgi:GH35 family endo-1,4-beta-xylanase